jgi:broad specificity phosphatase PhoE
MPLLYLIRHGRAAAGFGEATDPGLDSLGRVQAEAAAATLAQRNAPLPIFTSPLRRCRETAAALEKLWGKQAVLLPEVAEIPSPSSLSASRAVWLKEIMAGDWRSADAANPDLALAHWRKALIAVLLGTAYDAVIFTHFIAINVAVGSAIGEDRVICCRPDNGSITVFTHDSHALHLKERAREVMTQIG